MTPTFILVTPQLPENIGMSARGMMNCGLTNLRLVAPRDGWPHERGIAAGSGAFDLMSAPEIYSDTAAAIADLNYIYATSGKLRHMVKPILTGAAAAVDMAARISRGERVGVLFGPERTGLLDDDLGLANAIIQFPTNPDFASLNISQAVLLVAYEWLRVQDNTPDRRYDTNQSPPARADETAYFLTRLEITLAENGFFTAPHLREPVMRNISNMFRRADMSSQDVQTMQGIITALLGNKGRNRQ